MKKFLPILAATLLVACGPTQQDAIDLNDKLVAVQKACIKAEESFYDACKTYNPEEIKKALKTFKGKVLSAVDESEKTKNEKEFELYRNSAIKLLYAYKDLIDKEFSEYAKLYSIPDEQFTDADQKRSGKVADIINSTLGPLNDSFVMEQKIFAKKWDFTLKKDDLME